MKKLVSVLSLVALVAASAGVAAAAPGHGGGGFSGPAVSHGGPAFRPGAFGGHPGFQGHPGFRGHPGFHRGFHGRAFVGVAPLFFFPPVYLAPPVIVEPAPVYSQPPQPGYWYYCPSAGAYYPTVGSCPEPWVPVPPSGGY